MDENEARSYLFTATNKKPRMLKSCKPLYLQDTGAEWRQFVSVVGGIDGG